MSASTRSSPTSSRWASGLLTLLFAAAGFLGSFTVSGLGLSGCCVCGPTESAPIHPGRYLGEELESADSGRAGSEVSAQVTRDTVTVELGPRDVWVFEVVETRPPSAR